VIESWRKLVSTYTTTADVLRRVRNDIGGHFNPNVVQHTMQGEAWMNEVGSAEISREGGLKLEFVWLIGAIASARRMSAASYLEKWEELLHVYLLPSYGALTEFSKRAFVTLYWDKMGR